MTEKQLQIQHFGLPGHPIGLVMEVDWKKGLVEAKFENKIITVDLNIDDALIF